MCDLIPVKHGSRAQERASIAAYSATVGPNGSPGQWRRGTPRAAGVGGGACSNRAALALRQAPSDAGGPLRSIERASGRDVAAAFSRPAQQRPLSRRRTLRALHVVGGIATALGGALCCGGSWWCTGCQWARRGRAWRWGPGRRAASCPGGPRAPMPSDAACCLLGLPVSLRRGSVPHATSRGCAQPNSEPCLRRLVLVHMLQ